MMLPQAPLRSMMVTLAVGCAAGATIIGGLVAGWYDWRLFALAAAVGALIGLPAGLWIAHLMREQTPLPRPESATTDPDAARRAVNPARHEPYPPADDQIYAPGKPVRPS